MPGRAATSRLLGERSAAARALLPAVAAALLLVFVSATAAAAQDTGTVQDRAPATRQEAKTGPQQPGDDTGSVQDRGPTTRPGQPTPDPQQTEDATGTVQDRAPATRQEAKTGPQQPGDDTGSVQDRTRPTGPAEPSDGFQNPFDPAVQAGRAARGLVDALIKPTDVDVAAITPLTVQWLVMTPSPSSHVDGLRGSVTAIALGVVGVMMTFSIIAFWLGGLSASAGGGGLDVGDGLLRGVGATLAIVLWPDIFEQATALSNVVSDSVMSAGTREDFAHELGRVLAVAGGSGLSLLVVLILAFMGQLLLLGIGLLKIVLNSVGLVLFVGMPLVLALWPLRATSWVPRLAWRTFTVVMITPPAWGICFVTFVAVGNDVADGSASPLFGTLVGIALLFMCVALLWLLISVAGFGTADGVAGAPMKLLFAAGILGRFAGMAGIGRSGSGGGGGGGDGGPEAGGGDEDPVGQNTPLPDPGATPAPADAAASAANPVAAGTTGIFSHLMNSNAGGQDGAPGAGSPADGGATPAAPAAQNAGGTAGQPVDANIAGNWPTSQAVARSSEQAAERRRTDPVSVGRGRQSFSGFSAQQQAEIVNANDEHPVAAQELFAERATEHNRSLEERQAYHDLASMRAIDRRDAIPSREEFDRARREGLAARPDLRIEQIPYRWSDEWIDQPGNWFG